jgi:hypothetical protein
MLMRAFTRPGPFGIPMANRGPVPDKVPAIADAVPVAAKPSSDPKAVSLDTSEGAR